MVEPLPSLGLIFLLGLRHGFDPDHVAVIDNLTFQALPANRRLAPWIGFLFSLGHSVSVAVVAIGVALLFHGWAWPDWASKAMAWLAIALLVLVGAINLRALLRPGAFAPQGWRQALLPQAARRAARPSAVLMVGMAFGLVFDTAAQAAAWGAAASAEGGVMGAVAVSLAFALGMILTDTLDSRIMAGLLARSATETRIRRYRARVGWLIVLMSFAMAGYGIAAELGAAEAPDLILSGVGAAMAAGAVALLAVARPAKAHNP